MPAMAAPACADKPLRLAVLISGGGRTLANLIQRIADGRLRSVEIAVVISTRATVRGVTIAREAGLPLVIIRPKDFVAPHSQAKPAVSADMPALRAGMPPVGMSPPDMP